MDRFNTLIAAAKKNQIERCKSSGSRLCGGWAEDGIFGVSVTPVEGRISYLQTVKMTCYIDGKRVSKAQLQEAMS